MTPEELILAEIKERLRVQLAAIDSLDTKVSILLGTGAIVLAALLAAGLAIKPANLVTVVLLVAGMFLVFASFLDALLNYMVSEYNVPPDPGALLTKYFDRAVEETRRILAATMVDAFKVNQVEIDAKARELNVAMWLLFYGMILTGLAFGTMLIG